MSETRCNRFYTDPWRISWEGAGKLAEFSMATVFTWDGGAKWTLTSLQTNLYGGSPEHMSMFGATSAIFGIENGPQYRTLNGKRWEELPSLPAGKYRGQFICTVRQGTEASLGASVTGIPATKIDYPVVFTNHGNVSCVSQRNSNCSTRGWAGESCSGSAGVSRGDGGAGWLRDAQATRRTGQHRL